MAIIIPEGYAQVVLNFSSANVDGGVLANVSGWGGPLGDDPTSLAEFGETVGTSYLDNINEQMDSGVTLVSIDVIGPQSAATTLVGAAGENSTSLPPPNVATLVSFKTERRGRRAQGRAFWYGLVQESDIDERGIISPTQHGAVASRLQNFYTDIVAATTGVEQVILQGEQGTRKDGTPGTAPISPPPIVTSRVTSNLVSSQRRRLRR
jgi:hypothetical protein